MTKRIGDPKTTFWLVTAVSIILLAGFSAMAYSSLTPLTVGGRKRSKHLFATANQEDDDDAAEENATLRIAFLGNSMLYFNDCPRLLEQMLLAASSSRTTQPLQNSCLQPNASFLTLWERGNGMKEKFATPTAIRDDGTFDIGAPTVADLLASNGPTWNAIVLNDFTQSPARISTRQVALKTLEEHYIPLFSQIQQQEPKLKVVFLQTAAYRVPGMKNSDDLGTFDEFTDKVAEGYNEYVQLLRTHGIDCQLAPVGEAYRQVRQKSVPFWEKLYSWDNYHPSPYGTWLQACVLYCVLTGTAPPTYQPAWWNQSRYMQPPDQDPLPRPTAAEAEELRQLACRLCSVEVAPTTSAL